MTTHAPTADALARIHTAEAIGALVDAMRNAPKHSERIAAAQAVLDRGHGRAVQAVISIPARQAVAARLAALSDDELLLIAQGGEGSTGGKTRDPNAMPGAVGPHTANSDSTPQSPLRPWEDVGPITDAQFTKNIDRNDV